MLSGIRARVVDAPATTLSIAAAVVAIVVFAPWRPPGFVSDSWLLFSAHGGEDPARVLSGFIPNSREWYRPLTDAGFWLSWNLFGAGTLPSFLFHIACHVAASIMLGLITFSLTRHRVAAGLTAVVFLFALQAHEVVWDHSALHFSMASVPLTAAILAYLRRMRLVAFLLTILTLLIDETGLLILPLVALFEVVYLDWRGPSRLVGIRDALVRVAPAAAAVGGYLALRVVVGGGFFNEVGNPCRTLTCMGVGAMEYVNRLVVRPDPLIASLWTHRPEIFLAVAAGLSVAMVVLRPWRWRNPRLSLFGFGWAALTSLFFIYALWGYVADRFLYVPAMGASLLVGGVVPELRNRWQSRRSIERAALAAVIALFLAWLGSGVLAMYQRGDRWVAAGERALVLAEGVNALVPDPQPGTIVIVYEQPHSLSPTFPPGNTGPYIYLNGMQAQMRVLYGWPTTVLVPTVRESISAPPGYTPPPDVTFITLRIQGDKVVFEPDPPAP